MKYDVCIIGGCGHVGLPLSIAFALKGKRTAIVDSDRAACAKVQSGSMPFIEEDGERLLRDALATGNLTVAGDPSAIAESKAIVLVVGTPLDRHLSPSFHTIEAVLEEYSGYFRDGQLIVLRSTLYPGTSRHVARWAEKRSLRVHVATCPERIAQGFALREIFGLPQLVGSFSELGLREATKLFSALTNDIVVLEPLEAELAKLFNNAWRYIKFAAANQFYMIATDCEADFEKVYHGMTYKYPRASDLPGPGFAAGPCLFKDTMQLSAFTDNQFFIGHASMLVNEGLPHFIIKQIKAAHDIGNLRVGILGMAFKANIDDARDSLSFRLKNLLEMDAKEVLCSDPFVRDEAFLSTAEVVREADMFIVATPHAEYKTLQLGGKPVFDVWNILPQQQAATEAVR